MGSSRLLRLRRERGLIAKTWAGRVGGCLRPKRAVSGPRAACYRGQPAAASRSRAAGLDVEGLRGRRAVERSGSPPVELTGQSPPSASAPVVLLL